MKRLRGAHAREPDQGFTLIELLVVVLIIGILAAIAIPTMLLQRRNSVQATIESDLRNMAVQVEAFYATTGTYPDDVPTTVAGVARITWESPSLTTFSATSGISDRSSEVTFTHSDNAWCIVIDNGNAAKPRTGISSVNSQPVAVAACANGVASY